MQLRLRLLECAIESTEEIVEHDGARRRRALVDGEDVARHFFPLLSRP